MILSKQLGVFLNLVHNRFKQSVADAFAGGGYDLTPEQYLLLDTLWDEGTLSQQQIADIMLKDKNSVVKLIDALEEKKLVRRKSNPRDRRQNLISTTPKSMAIKDEVTSLALSSVQEITGGIAECDLNTFIEVLHKMARNMDESLDLIGMAKKFPSRKGEAVEAE